MKKKINKNRILVTGGAGFIGSHLVRKLLKDNDYVVVYDNLLKGIHRIKDLLNNKNMELVKADIIDEDKLLRVLRKGVYPCPEGIDVVWHFAGNTDIPLGFKFTDLDIKNAVIGTHNVLEAMRLAGVKKIIFPSTGAVYGETKRVPTPEDTILLPLSLYGAGKAACESFISAYCHLFKFQAWIFRFGNAVGSGLSHGVIYDFINKLIQNRKELLILGDGTQEKNYFLVEECIEGMMYVISKTKDVFDGYCDVFNLGPSTSTNVVKIAKMIIKEMGLKDVRLKLAGEIRGWPGDQPQVHLDTTKVEKIGWKPYHISDKAVRISVRRMLPNSYEANTSEKSK